MSCLVLSCLVPDVSFVFSKFARAYLGVCHVFLRFTPGFSFGFPSNVRKLSNEFAKVFLPVACSLHGFRKEPISAQFSQSFGRTWTPSGPLSDAFGTALGSPWAHLGPPWTPQTSPWAHLGRPLGHPWDPDRKTLRKGVFGSTFLGPPFSLKNMYFLMLRNNICLIFV